MARRRPRLPGFLNPQRDDFSVARDLADDTLELVRGSLLESIERSSAIRSPLSEVEDRRFYHPAGALAPARSSRRHFSPVISIGHRQPARDRSPPRSRAFFAPAAVEVMGFKAPRHVAICVRRKIRKEVMHAAGIAGGKTSKRRRRNSHSNIWCK